MQLDAFLNAAANVGSVQGDGTSEQLDNIISQLPPEILAQLEPAADGNLSQNIQKSRQGTFCNVLFGRVQYAMPHLHWYRVVLEGTGGEIPCAFLGTGGVGLMGPKESTVIPPNTGVFVILHPSEVTGYIIGTIPELTEDGNHTYPDWIVQGSGVGLLRNRYYTEYLRLLEDEGAAINNSCHRPLDSLLFDKTIVTETGLMLHLDPEHLQLSVNELAGLFAFYKDGMVRLTGEQLDTWGPCLKEQNRDDEGELFVYKGYSVYPWEALGRSQPNQEIHEEVADEDVLHKEAKAKFELKERDAVPFDRYQEYYGYLGQGYIRQMVVPPTTTSYTLSNPYAGEGVFREQVSLDGEYALESAKSVTIAKRGLIPIPKRRKLVEDYSDDSDSAENQNYKASGQYGDAADHKVGDLENQAENRCVFSAAALLDLHAYTFNWKNLHPFKYHEKDYLIEHESAHRLGAVQYIPPFGDLASKMFLPVPDPVTMKVDERYGDVKYWKMLQHLTFTDDGATVLTGGNGEEIRMSGGNIQISCPGKIMIQSGNTTAILAGDDFVARAYNSADITATNHDVRIKGEVNTQILAGNSGEGVLLLENRATDKTHDYPAEGGEKIRGSGVIVKAKDSQVALLGDEVYLRAGLTDQGGGQVVIDANKGDGDVRIVGSNIYEFAKNKIRQGFGLPVQATNTFQESGNYFSGSVRVDALFCNTGAIFRSDVRSSNGHFYSSQGGDVSRLRNPAQDSGRLDLVSQRVRENDEAHKADYEAQVKQKYYVSGKIGEQDTIKKVSFSLRKEAQYGTEDFKLPQTHWQILNNVGDAGESWRENTVRYQESVEMQPWPGKEKWEGETLLKVTAESLKMYDLEKGYAKPDKELYEEKTLGDFETGSPASDYKIIPSPSE